jgi:hypothetical protein
MLPSAASALSALDSFPVPFLSGGWVISFPMPLRYWMAKSPKLMSSVLAIVIRVIDGHYSRREKSRLIRPIRKLALPALKIQKAKKRRKVSDILGD